ncbi:MAG: phosphotransferase [Steroidobacteraceae bacterium]
MEPLSGGITNRNFRVTDDRGGQFVVRAGRDLPEHGILRFHELAAARAAHAAGISPEVVFAGDGFLVSRFIDGHTLTAEDVRNPRQLEWIVPLLRRCHQEIPRFFRGPALVFWVFQVIRNYLAALGGPSMNPFEVSLASLESKAQRLEQALGPITLVFGHNDLLAANLIDDGKRLWLIDWDYAGFNTPLFDLANLASNNALDEKLETLLIESYFGGPVDAACRRGIATMKCASLLREALWGAVSKLNSSIDFDFAEYARDYLQRFEREWLSFERTLSA